MEQKYLIAIILVIVALYCLCTKNNKTENFANKYVANDHIYLGRRRDGYDLLDDSLFTNVVTYVPDDDPYECGGRTAIDKCLSEAPKGARCIEFGLGHAAYMFPPEESQAN
jgi:hypothetical protein